MGKHTACCTYGPTIKLTDVYTQLGVQAGTKSEGEASKNRKKNRPFIADRVRSTGDPTSKSPQWFSLKIPIRQDQRDATGQLNGAD